MDNNAKPDLLSDPAAQVTSREILQCFWQPEPAEQFLESQIINFNDWG